jgi:hypothetical protein
MLTDDPPPRRSRPRWVDGLGLAAVVGGILAVGVLGDGGEPAVRPTPTTVPTAVPTTAPRTSVPTTTTSTSLAQPAALGPLLPRSTGVVLFLLGPSTPKLIDVDTGTVRSISIPTLGSAAASPHGFVVGDVATGELRLISAAGDVQPLPLAASGGLLPGADGRWWSVAGGGERASLSEVDAGFQPTGPTIDLPPNVMPAGGVEDGIVVSQFGSVSLVARDGHVRDLGAGDVVAVRNRLLARFGCPRLRCTVDLVDTRSGRVRPVAGLPDVTSHVGGRFSPDGRWLALILNEPTASVLVLVDVDRGRAELLRSAARGPFAFSTDGRWLFVVDGSLLDAYDTVEEGWSRLPVDVTATHDLAASDR